jgi:hypothetical protein
MGERNYITRNIQIPEGDNYGSGGSLSWKTLSGSFIQHFESVSPVKGPS